MSKFCLFFLLKSGMMLWMDFNFITYGGISMKRMRAMVLSTICIMNALAFPVATAFADTNGYELVDLSANSDKLMGAG